MGKFLLVDVLAVKLDLSSNLQTKPFLNLFHKLLIFFSLSVIIFGPRYPYNCNFIKKHLLFTIRNETQWKTKRIIQKQKYFQNKEFNYVVTYKTNVSQSSMPLLYFSCIKHIILIHFFSVCFK